MLISIDPTELIAASETLRGCAIEVADIGSQLLACAACPMPAEIQSLVDGFVRETDRALDLVGSELGSYAVDLINRAQIATTDSLAAAASAFEPNPFLATATSSSSGLGTSVIGGQSLMEPIIFGSAPAAAGVPNVTVSIVGGGAVQGNFGAGGADFVGGVAVTGVSTTGGSAGGLGGDLDLGGGGGLTVSYAGERVTNSLGFPTAEAMAAGSQFQTMNGGAWPVGAVVPSRALTGDATIALLDVTGGTVNNRPITTVPQGLG